MFCKSRDVSFKVFWEDRSGSRRFCFLKVSDLGGWCLKGISI